MNRSARLDRVELVDVRSYHRLTLQLSSALTVFVGPNGIGKTNLLEACAVVATGASPRTSTETRLVAADAAGCRIHARMQVGDEVHEREVRIELGRGKQLRLDGSVVRSIDVYAAQTPALSFLPERLLAIRGAPARRRALVDQLATRLLPSFSATARNYTAALQQRNVLLRRAKGGIRVDDQLAPWDAQLVEHGSDMRRLRRQILDRLAAPFEQRLAELTDLADGTFELVSRGSDDIAAELEGARELDRRRGSTTTGPHLDDILPKQAGRDLRAFGSTGEQRAALLAFTLAARDLLFEDTGIAPILLLDEPWAELDAQRRRRLSEVLDGLGQVLTTSTEPPAHLLEQARSGRDVSFVAVSSGSTTPWPDDPNTT